MAARTRTPNNTQRSWKQRKAAWDKRASAVYSAMVQQDDEGVHGEPCPLCAATWGEHYGVTLAMCYLNKPDPKVPLPHAKMLAVQARLEGVRYNIDYYEDHIKKMREIDDSQ